MLTFPTATITLIDRVPNRDEYTVHRFRYLSETTYEFFFQDGTTKSLRKGEGEMFDEYGALAYGRVSGPEVWSGEPPEWFTAEMVEDALEQNQREHDSLTRILQRLTV